MADNESACPLPVGAIYISIIPTNPMHLRPTTYRKAFGKGRVIVGVDNESNIANLKEPEKTGGAYTHTHVVDTSSESGEGGDGSGIIPESPTQASSSMQPYITAYMFVRVLKKDWVQDEDLNPYNIDTTQDNIYAPYGTPEIVNNGNPYW